MRTVIESQYRASLEMLRQVIELCPPALWADPQDKNPFWQVAFHTLFFVHLYSQPEQQAFTLWPKHRKDYEMMGPPPWDPDYVPQIGEPYTPAEVVEYLDFVLDEVARQVAALDPDGPSGFGWLPMTKLELQFYSIRHAMQHVGELAERLGARAGVDVPWIALGIEPAATPLPQE
jgi:hypothetical protein